MFLSESIWNYGLPKGNHVNQPMVGVNSNESNLKGKWQKADRKTLYIQITNHLLQSESEIHHEIVYICWD